MIAVNGILHETSPNTQQRPYILITKLGINSEIIIETGTIFAATIKNMRHLDAKSRREDDVSRRLRGLVFGGVEV